MDVKTSGWYNSPVFQAADYIKQEKGFDSDYLQKNVDKLSAAFEALAEKKEAEDELAKEYKASQKAIVENMLKTIRLFNSRNYTRQSWIRAMADVKKAAEIINAGDPSLKQINRALSTLRAAMSKLKSAAPRDERGREKDRARTNEKQLPSEETVTIKGEFSLGSGHVNIVSAPQMSTEPASDDTGTDFTV